MKKKKLFNTSEYKTVVELRAALEGTGFYVHPEMQVKNVIALEENDKISKKDRNTFNTASFDFVIYNKESIPEFVIEFDGPHHSAYIEKRKADLRKNRLCIQAGLPILRIDDSFLKKYEEITFLKFILKRFVAWKAKIGLISQEITERLTSSTSSKDVDYDDPGNDPSFIFDINHPFPASVEIAARLFNEHQIITTYVDDEIYHEATNSCPYLEFRSGLMGEWPIGEYSRRVERGYQLEKITKHAKGQFGCEKLYELSVRVDCKWGSPTNNHNDVVQLDRVPTILFQGIPGTSMFELSNHFCDYLALCKLEEWAENRSFK